MRGKDLQVKNSLVILLFSFPFLLPFMQINRLGNWYRTQFNYPIVVHASIQIGQRLEIGRKEGVEEMRFHKSGEKLYLVLFYVLNVARNP